jgi:RpiB/LacA/LacB family sugar-phosphate isomerase
MSNDAANRQEMSLFLNPLSRNELVAEMSGERQDAEACEEKNKFMGAVVIGSDHAGLFLKQDIVLFLRKGKWQLLDVGIHNSEPADYPDIARQVGQVILDGRFHKGIVVCGSGVGVCVAANKIRGIRAGICHDTYSARQGVEHDGMNVLCLGARIVGVEMAKEVVTAFLKAQFSGAERHVRRLDKVRQLERVWGCNNNQRE